MRRGKHGEYGWLESDSPLAQLSDVVKAVPELVRGYYVAITSFDSGLLKVSSDEITAGWRQFEGLAISPRVDSTIHLPSEGYDEWYVLPSPDPFPYEDRFINYNGFSLRDPNDLLNTADPTWDHVGIHAEMERLRQLQSGFWNAMLAAGAVTFLGEGSRVIVATKLWELLDRVQIVLEAVEAR